MSDETVPRLGHLEDARNSRTSPKVLWSYRRTVSCGNGVSAVRRRVKHTPQKEGKTVDLLRDEAAITLMIVAGFVSLLLRSSHPHRLPLRNVLIAVIVSRLR